MSPKTQRVIGWVLSGLIALFQIGPSAGSKFADWAGKQELFDHIGFSVDLIKKIAVLQIVITVLFLIPRTAFVGAILLTGYLGAAACTHVRVGDLNFIMPIVIGVLVWVALGLRQPEVFRLAVASK